MSPERQLRIEQALAKASNKPFIDKYRLMKYRLLDKEYEHCSQ
jgi:hypothetical protein